MKYLRNDPAIKPRRKELRLNQTEAEKALWKRIRNKQYNGLKFFRQYGIGPYILDFYCPEVKLAIELDGGQHNDVENKDYDETRTEYLKAHGIEVIRFWNTEVLGNMEGVLAKVEAVITPPAPSYLKRGESR